MRIFLKLGLALQVFVNRIEHFDFFGRERKACWKHILAIAGASRQGLRIPGSRARARAPE